MLKVVEVVLWGRTIGAVAQRQGEATASFEYARGFQSSGIQVSPLHMCLNPKVYRFPELARSFHGLPGLLAEVLPDRFGNALIDAWLVRSGREPADFGALTSKHQMTVNGKREGFEVDDLVEVARQARLPRGRAKLVLEEICEAVSRWTDIAHDLDVGQERIAAIASTHRLHWRN